MDGMFYLCSSLKSIDLSSFNTTNLNNMNSLFGGCSSLKIENVKINENGIKFLDEECWEYPKELEDLTEDF